MFISNNINFSFNGLLTNHINNYLYLIHPNQYNIKLPTKNWNIKKNTIHKQKDFINDYLKSIKNIPFKYYFILYKYVQIISKLYTKNNLNLLNNINWNFLMSINNIEDGMLFTLDKYIIINNSTLNRILSYGTGIESKMINDLIHEKIHIFQRFNQSKFNNFYIYNYKFLSDKIHPSKIPIKLQKKYMTNPDSNFDYWLYKLNNKKYYPIFHKYEQCYAYLKNSLNNRISLKKFQNHYKFPINIQFYHPNEIFAFIITNMIYKCKITKKYKNFLLSLYPLNINHITKCQP
jgi:hypothetical protein